MSCRLPQQIGASRADTIDDFQGKSILFIGVFTRPQQTSAKWLGMKTVCIDGFCSFDLRKTADCCLELLDSEDPLSNNAKETIRAQNEEKKFDSFLSIDAKNLEEKYKESLLNVPDHGYDFVYLDSYLFNSRQLWAVMRNFENLVVKIDPSKIEMLQALNNSLLLQSEQDNQILKTNYRISYMVACVGEDTMEILMKSIEIIDQSHHFPIIKSTLEISDSDKNNVEVSKLKDFCQQYSFRGIIEFIFTCDPELAEENQFVPRELMEIRPYIDNNTIELFETATGINLMALDLLIITNKSYPHQLFREDAKNRLFKAFDSKFKWSLFRFFSLVRFSVFADIGGYGFRDIPMPGSQIQRGMPICSEVSQNICNEPNSEGIIKNIEDLKSKYENEKDFVFKILGVHYYLKKP